MNQVATQQITERRATPVEAYAAQVIGDEGRSADLFRALPKHVPPHRFQRNLINLLMQNPEMMKYDARLVYREVSKAAALGLLLDPHLGEGYIVPVWNGASRRQEPQLRVGYRGLMKLARQSGEVANIYPGEVREKDHFLADEGTEKRLEHRPDYRRSRGEVSCYYAVVIYRNGTKDFEVMDMDSIYEVREKSDGWRAFQAGKIKSTPWATDEGEMCKKTVLKRLLKRVEQSPDLADAIGHDNEYERPAANIIDVSREPARQPRSIEGRLDAFAAEPEPEEQPETESAAPVTATPQAGAHQEAEDVAPQAASAPSASPEEGTAPDGGADAPEVPVRIRDAMDKGRAARRSGYSREVPRALQYKTKADEAEAFLKGWDEENAEIAAEENGSV